MMKFPSAHTRTWTQGVMGNLEVVIVTEPPVGFPKNWPWGQYICSCTVKYLVREAFFPSLFTTSRVLYHKTYIFLPFPSPAVKIFSLSNICWRNVGTEPTCFLSVKLPSGKPPTPPLPSRPTLCWLLTTVGSQTYHTFQSQRILIVTITTCSFMCTVKQFEPVWWALSKPEICLIFSLRRRSSKLT